DYEGPFYHFGVLVEGSAKPDLGTNSDPGDNIFDNQSKPGEYFGFSIGNQTKNKISAQGNYYDTGTYDQMKACSKSTTPPCKIITIDSKTGEVNFAGFKQANP
ncbi:MAG: hypothetical protein ABIA67_06385, partial [Candidatus Margulisiibacteriota bacterium]